MRVDPAAFIIAALSAIALSGLFLAGKGQLLRMGIPAAACMVALPLYFRRPAAFLEFTLWTWLLTPFVRRVVDWRVGFADHNLVLLTPLLVSGIAILDLRKRARVARIRIAPFVLCGAALVYGLVVGLALHPSGEVIYGLVNWLSPLLLGLYIYLHWEELDQFSRVIQRVALCGLLVLGTYGIYQFFRPPIWDTMWLENLPGGIENSTFGRPEPQQIRVWSTLNAPGPFASVMTALLFLVIPKRSKWKLPAVAAGLYSLMLSLVRTAWLTGIVGIFYLAKNSNRKLFAKVLFASVVLLLGVGVLANSSWNLPIIQDRIKSLSDLKNDESVQDRTRLYTDFSKELLQLPVGIGLNNSDFYKGYPLDSGPIRMLLNLGWAGTIVYSIGLFQVVALVYSGKESKDPTLLTSLTIIVTLLLQLLSGLVLVNSTGALFWLAVGLGLASVRRTAEGMAPQPANATDAEPEPVLSGSAFAGARTRTIPGILSSLEEAR